ncbi:MAG: hypothetical protein ACREXT_01150, partial [Gammaproteobacteria bacterium]
LKPEIAIIPLRPLDALAALIGLAAMNCCADSLDAAEIPSQPTVPAACASAIEETPLMEEQGSAGILYNLAEHPKSIRAVAAKLLSAALDSSAAKARPVCTAGCAPAKDPEVVYRVAPATFLPKSKQTALCLRLEHDTQTDPLNFPAHEFKTVDDFNNWVTEFSQGRGPEGEQLYVQCGGNCSPRYTFFIAPGASGMRVQSEVICGLARDRDQEDYNVSTALRKRCEAEPLASAPD